NITLTNKVSKEFSANGVIAKGELIVTASNNEVASINAIAAEATSTKINLTNVSVQNVKVERDGIALTSSTKIVELTVAEKVSAIEINADIEKLTINSTVPNFELNVQGKITE